MWLTAVSPYVQIEVPMAKIGKKGYKALAFLTMKAQPLNVSLTAELQRYVKDQVRSGRYQNENEAVRNAIRQMQQREIEQFERLFGTYPGAPQAEPTADDEVAIKAAVRRHRKARRASATA